jgi:hypothetical protein
MAKSAVPDTTSVAAPKKKRDASGRVQFDDRGQAVWAWEVRTGIFDLNASTARVRALAEPTQDLRVDTKSRPPNDHSLHNTALTPSVIAPPLALGEDPGSDPYASAHKRK